MADGEGRSPRGHHSNNSLAPQIANTLDRFFEEGLVDPRDLHEQFYSQLRVLSTADALDALSKVENALRTSTVRNLPAYLAGVIRRITQLPTGPQATLFPEAQAALEELYDRGIVRRGDLDSKSLAALSNKPPEYQVLIMDTFRDRNLHGIRNMAAFFTSHQSQVDKDLHSGHLRLPRLRPPQARPPPRERFPPQYQDRGRGPPPREPYDPAFPPPPGPAGYGAPPPYQQPPYAGAPPPGAAPPQHAQQPPYGAPAAPAGPVIPKDYATEQAQWGIRIDEFQNLSPFAKYVHPAAALRLQQLWDVDQNKLVSVLNEASWEALAGLDAANGVAAINECAEAMKTAADDLVTINQIFIRVAAKFPHRPDAPSLATIALAASAPAAPTQYTGPGPSPPPQGAPQQPYAPPAYGAAAPPPAAGPPPSQYPPPAAHGSYGGPPPREYGYQGPPPGPDTYSSRGPPPPAQLPGQGSTLPPSVQAEIAEILRRWGGMLKLDHFEGRAMEMLLNVGERNALAALEEFGRNDPANMRSPTAYLIGCIKKFESDRGYEGGGGRGGPPYRGRGPPRGGGGRRGGRGGPPPGRGRGGPPPRHHPY